MVTILTNQRTEAQELGAGALQKNSSCKRMPPSCQCFKSCISSFAVGLCNIGATDRTDIKKGRWEEGEMKAIRKKMMHSFFKIFCYIYLCFTYGFGVCMLHREVRGQQAGMGALIPTGWSQGSQGAGLIAAEPLRGCQLDLRLFSGLCLLIRSCFLHFTL